MCPFLCPPSPVQGLFPTSSAPTPAAAAPTPATAPGSSSSTAAAASPDPVEEPSAAIETEEVALQRLHEAQQQHAHLRLPWRRGKAAAPAAPAPTSAPPADPSTLQGGGAGDGLPPDADPERDAPPRTLDEPSGAACEGEGLAGHHVMMMMDQAC